MPVTLWLKVRASVAEWAEFTLLAVDPAYTTTFLAENLSLSRKTVSLRLKMLKENGLIERIGSDRKGYWKLLK